LRRISRKSDKSCTSGGDFKADIQAETERDSRSVTDEILHWKRVGYRPFSVICLVLLLLFCRWCDCPADYGPSTTIYNRFNHWSRRGFWLKLLDALMEADAVTKSTAIDSTYIKAQRPAFGARGACGASDRPSLWPDADARQCLRHEGRSGASRTGRTDAMPARRQRL
jgi:transposase